MQINGKAIEISGKAIEVSQIEKGQGRNGEWQRMYVVVEFDDNGYKKKIAVDFMNSKVEYASKVRKGDNVTVAFDITSRQGSNGKWYTSASGWRIKTDDLPY